MPENRDDARSGTWAAPLSGDYKNVKHDALYGERARTVGVDPEPRTRQVIVDWLHRLLRRS